MNKGSDWFNLKSLNEKLFVNMASSSLSQRAKERFGQFLCVLLKAWERLAPGYNVLDGD